MALSNRRAVSLSDDASLHPGYRVAAHGPFERIAVGDLELESGAVLPGAELGVVTLGELNARADNAVLLTTWYSGSHAAYVRNYVGKGRAIDPAEYFVIIVNQLGNGFSTSSIDPAPSGGRAASPLPALSVVDDVVAQERMLRETFGVERLALVAGCSMGAMQAYEWASRFPERVQRVAAVAGTASPTPYVEILIRSLLEALECDDDTDEAAQAALRRHADLWALFGYTDAFWNDGGWRELGFDSRAQFWQTSYEPLMNSRSITVLTDLARKWSRAGRYTDGRGIDLGRIHAQTVVIPIEQDNVFPPRDCRRDADQIVGARVETIDTVAGHLGILGLSAGYRSQFDRIVGRLLSE